MKPPVDAPTSIADFPFHVQSKGLKAASSLNPPRLTNGMDPRIRPARQPRPRCPGLSIFWPFTRHTAGQDERLRLLARVHQPAVDQQLIEPLFARRLHALRSTTRSASSCSHCPRSPNGREIRARAQARLRHLLRTFESINRRERDLPLLRVLACRLAERFRGLLDVEDVVDDLKGEADMLAIFR